MTKHFEPGQKVMWNSTRRGWVEVTIVRPARDNYHWIVTVDDEARQERILPQRMLTVAEWQLLTAVTEGL